MYSYYKGHLLGLVKNNPDPPMAARKLIIRELGQGLKELHSKSWIHLGRMHERLIASPSTSFADETVQTRSLIMPWSTGIEMKMDNLELNAWLGPNQTVLYSSRTNVFLITRWEMSCGAARKDKQEKGLVNRRRCFLLV